MSIDISKVRAIDPPGCGCTECLIGEYVPFDHPEIDEVLEAVLDGRISPRNNLNDGTLIIYRDTVGRVQTTVNSTMLASSDYEFIPPYAEAYDFELEDKIAPEDIEFQTEEKQTELIQELLDGAHSGNPSSDGFIAYRTSYGENGLIKLYGISGEPVILWYYD